MSRKGYFVQVNGRVLCTGQGKVFVQVNGRVLCADKVKGTFCRSGKGIFCSVRERILCTGKTTTIPCVGQAKTALCRSGEQ